MEILKKNLTLQEKDLLYMKEAIKQAKLAYEADEVPVGTVIVYEDRVVAKGYNQVELLKDATAHAEMICLTQAYQHLDDFRLKDMILYSTLEPCVMCAGAMFLSRIKRLVWGARDTRVGANGSWIDLFSKNHPIHEIEVLGGVLEEESAYLLSSFFQKKRREKNGKEDSRTFR